MLSYVNCNMGDTFFFIKCVIIMAHRAWVCDVTIWYWYTQYHMVLVHTVPYGTGSCACNCVERLPGLP